MSGHDDNDAPLGYKRPPRWTQFTKGKSGNPGGRPPKPRPSKEEAPGPSKVDDILRAQFKRVLKLADGRELETLEAVTLALNKSALKGNSHAQANVLRLAFALEERDAQRAQEEERRRQDDFEMFKGWKAARQREWDQALARGEEPENPWPHPDDILLDYVNSNWSLRGPANDRDAPFFRYVQAQRDLMFMRSVIDRAKRPQERWSNPSFYDLWVRYDVMLPQRWQLGADGAEMVMGFFLLLPLAELHAWEKLYEERCQHHPEPHVSREDQKEIYKVVNKLMKPLLKPHGYRTLKEFEHAIEQHGDDMPWPKTAGAKGAG
jgi:hypothetical protein